MKLLISSTLKTRLLSALVLAPLVLAVLLYGGMAFFMLCGLALMLCVYEWVRMAQMGRYVFLFAPAGVLYIFAAVIAFSSLPSLKGPLFPVMILLLVWISDSTAYGVGKWLGGPKMAPRLSPGKTWAGFAGAVLGPALVIVIGAVVRIFAEGLDSNGYSTLSEAVHFPVENYMLLFGMAILVGVCGQIGDVLVSAMKRHAGVKDTGNLIPGHGGLLDRIDSLLLVSLVFAALLWISRFLSSIEGAG